MERKVIQIIPVSPGRDDEGQVLPGWHTCPYSEEINCDYFSLCDCDDERMHECAMDV